LLSQVARASAGLGGNSLERLARPGAPVIQSGKFALEVGERPCVEGVGSGEYVATVGRIAQS